MFCREAVADLQELAKDPSFPPVLLTSLASVEASRDFLAERWPEVRAIADPERVLYDGMGRKKGSFWQLFGPGVWRRGYEAWRRGYSVGRAVGNPLVLGGVFLVDESGRVLRQHEPKHAGDHPAWGSFVSES